MAKLGCGPLLPVLLFLLLASVPIMALQFGPVKEFARSVQGAGETVSEKFGEMVGEKPAEKTSSYAGRKMNHPEGLKSKSLNRVVKMCKMVKKSQDLQQNLGGGTTTYTIVVLGVGDHPTFYTADDINAARLDWCGQDVEVEVALARVQPSSFPVYGTPSMSLTPRPLPGTGRVYP